MKVCEGDAKDVTTCSKLVEKNLQTCNGKVCEAMWRFVQTNYMFACFCCTLGPSVGIAYRQIVLQPVVRCGSVRVNGLSTKHTNVYICNIYVYIYIRIYECRYNDDSHLWHFGYL